MGWIIQSSFSMQSYGKQLSLFYDQYQSFIPTFTNEWKSVNIPKPTHFQNGDQMNISWNIKFCTQKNIVSHSSHPIPLHPTQSHHWCFNVWTYCIYFWYRNNDEPKKLPGVDGRGLGWQRWDPSHSNPTPIPPGPIVQNCLVFYLLHEGTLIQAKGIIAR